MLSEAGAPRCALRLGRARRIRIAAFHRRSGTDCGRRAGPCARVLSTPQGLAARARDLERRSGIWRPVPPALRSDDLRGVRRSGRDERDGLLGTLSRDAGIFPSDPSCERRIERVVSGSIMESVITCPKCGYSKREKMPTDTCQFFYECASCHALLRPKAGDCCVFCSYGSAKCPPMQAAGIK